MLKKKLQFTYWTILLTHLAECSKIHLYTVTFFSDQKPHILSLKQTNSADPVHEQSEAQQICPAQYWEDTVSSEYRPVLPGEWTSLIYFSKLCICKKRMQDHGRYHIEFIPDHTVAGRRCVPLVVHDTRTCSLGWLLRTCWGSASGLVGLNIWNICSSARRKS